MNRRTVLVMGLVVLAGCGGTPDLRPDPVRVTGTVRQGDRPLKDVALNLQPTDSGGGHPGTCRVGPDGRVTVNLVPGKYVFYVTEIDGKPAAFKPVPQKYHTPQAEHTVEIAEGKEFEVNIGG